MHMKLSLAPCKEAIRNIRDDFPVGSQFSDQGFKTIVWGEQFCFR